MKALLQRYLFCITSLALLATTSCKREDAEYLGPAVVYAPADFNVADFTVSDTIANFTNGDILFNASFSSFVSWELTVVGLESKAIKSFQGKSDNITDLAWNGGNDGVFFFREGEAVSAKLIFYGTLLMPKIDLVVDKAADLSVQGSLLKAGDFELRDSTSLWYSFEGIPNVESKRDSIAKDYSGKRVNAVQGKSYFSIRGMGDPAQTAFVTGVEYAGLIRPKLTENAEEVWFNVYVYGSGDANMRLDIEMHEDDINTLRGYNGKMDDSFVGTVIMSHKGWKLFSFKYSDLPASVNADFGGSGNKIYEPHRIAAVAFILLKATDPTSPVEVYFDYPIFTVGGPFDPSK